MLVCGRIYLLGARVVFLCIGGLVEVGADAGPEIYCVRGCDGEPAGYTNAFGADHVHRVAPVALSDVRETTDVAGVGGEEPIHGPAEAFEDRVGIAIHAGDFFVKEFIVACLTQVDLQGDGEPDAMIGMRYLVDVLEHRAFCEQDTIWHGTVLFLLANRCQYRFSSHIWLDEAHSHVVL
ncbi:Glycoside hydrolase family 94 protein [Pyrenophora tritici-repentis]|nr:Glycoside hydrolase family 94 protein [Pyrenophora tritici-repentis]